MARLTPLDPEEFAPEVQEYLGADALTDKEKLAHWRIFAHRPAVLLAFGRFYDALQAASILPPRLIELVRLRIAFHNQCRVCMAHRFAGADDGVTEDLVCELAAPQEAPNLTERERSALRYADLLASNHLAINEKTFDDLRQHFDEPEIVELGAYCGLFVGFGRVGSSWDMVDDLPARFRERGTVVTPWGSDAVRV